MAEIRHLENRHDVNFSAKGGPIWIKFCRLVTFGRIQWYVIPEPRITLQGVRIPSAILKIVFLPYFIIFVFNAV